MNETSLSLLEQLRDSPGTEAWERLHRIYEPLIRVWLRKYDVQDADADDLLQELLVAVSADIGRFEHNGHHGAFRAWLKTILVNRLRKFWRRRDRRREAKASSDIDRRLAELDDPDGQMTLLWNQQHDQYVLRQVLTLTGSHFEKTTWQAFRRVALEGVKAAEVAQELGISLNAVCLAKSRVMRRLRRESEGLIDSSSTFRFKG